MSYRSIRALKTVFALGSFLVFTLPLHLQAQELDEKLTKLLQQHDFSGNLQSDSQTKLGRSINSDLAEIGKSLFFDRILSLNNDNTCSGCHAPQAGFADTQSIAIGVNSKNCLVGPDRDGPHNQRRSPTVANAVLYPVMMWNGRFSSLSGEAFDNSKGFLFPLPEGNSKFAPYDTYVKMLMAAQGHMPPTELPEMAGFPPQDTSLFLTMSRFGGDFALVEENKLKRAPGITLDRAKQFNQAEVAELLAPKILTEQDAVKNCFGLEPEPLPVADLPIVSLNEPIRRVVLNRIQESEGYASAFSKVYPDAGSSLTFGMIGAALAEFQLQLVFADAPIDQYARGDASSMTEQEKRGAILFFDQAKCVACHTVSGAADELFSDFAMHNIGVPPLFPGQNGNVEFLGPNKDLDLGLAEFTGVDIVADHFRFRTSPLRNVGLAPSFMHNGAYTKLEDAIRHHLDAQARLADYNPAKAGVLKLRDVASSSGEIAKTIDPLLQPPALSDQEIADLVAFVSDSLTDERLKKACDIVPDKLLSGNPLPTFQGC